MVKKTSRSSRVKNLPAVATSVRARVEGCPIPALKLARTAGTQVTELPAPAPAGTLPPEDSRLWHFCPKAVQQGEEFILPDTLDFLAERRYMVPIWRDYPEHPRWRTSLVPNADDLTTNSEIISEVHIACRLYHGLPPFPDWVATKMSLKRSQADLAYRLTLNVRESFAKHGRQALADMAQRMPASYMNLVTKIALPRRPGDADGFQPGAPVHQGDVNYILNLDNSASDEILRRLKTELERRESEAKSMLNAPLDLPDSDPRIAVAEAVVAIKQASTPGGSVERFINLKDGSNQLTHYVADVQQVDAPEPIEWD